MGVYKLTTKHNFVKVRLVCKELYAVLVGTIITFLNGKNE
jgi:hypothetical protein